MGTAETRPEKIMEVAGRLFRERGFDAVSIRDLGASLDVSTSTLYHHFRNKQEILFAITERFMVDFNAELVPIAEGEGTATDRLYRIVVAHMTFQDRRRDELLTQNFFRRALEDKQSKRIVELMRQYRHAVQKIIEDGQRNGEFGSTDSDLCVGMILDMANGVRDWFGDGGRYLIEELADEYAVASLLICRAKKVPPPRKPKRRAR